MTGHGRVWLAVAMMAVGLALLVDRLRPELGLWDLAARWWPLVLIGSGLLGIVNLLRLHSALMGPLVMMALGGLLLLVTLDPIPARYRAVGWPLLVIAAGIALLVHRALGGPPEPPAIRKVTLVGQGRYLSWSPAESPLAIVRAVASGCVIAVAPPSDGLVDARLEITAFASSVEVQVDLGWSVDVDVFRLHRSTMAERRHVGGIESGGDRPRLIVVMLSAIAGVRVTRPTVR